VRFFELQSKNLSCSTATIPYKHKPQMMSQAAVRSRNVRIYLPLVRNDGLRIYKKEAHPEG